jgi:L-iditol 2-dehydrogenase
VSCADYRRHGAFADFVSVPARIVHRLPDSLSFEHAALIEATSIAVHAVRLAHPEPGSTAVVVGSGMIGLLAIQALRIAGAHEIIAVDIDGRKLGLAQGVGADHTFNSRTQDTIAGIKELTQGQGAALAVEAVGNTAALQTAVGAVRKGGTAVVIGNITPVVELPLQTLVTREIRLLGSCASAGEIPACIDYLAGGKIRVQSLISAVAPLEEGPVWFQKLYRRDEDLMKVVLRSS